jgi:hypothetical protein
MRFLKAICSLALLFLAVALMTLVAGLFGFVFWILAGFSVIFTVISISGKFARWRSRPRRSPSR